MSLCLYVDFSDFYCLRFLCLYCIPMYVESYDFLLVLNYYVRRSNILFQLRINCSNSAMALAWWFGTRQTLLPSSTMKTDSWCCWSSLHHIIISSASIINCFRYLLLNLAAFAASGACAFVFVLFVSVVLVLLLLSEHAISVVVSVSGPWGFMLCSV